MELGEGGVSSSQERKETEANEGESLISMGEKKGEHAPIHSRAHTLSLSLHLRLSIEDYTCRS